MKTNDQLTSARRKIQQNTEKKKETQPRTRGDRDECMRLYHQNVNGIKSGRKERLEKIIAHMQNLKVSVYSLVETNA